MNADNGRSSFPFNAASVEAALLGQNWRAVAEDLFRAAEPHSPAGLYLDPHGRLGIAETMVEVNGLLLAIAVQRDPDEGYEVEDQYWVADWIDSALPGVMTRCKEALAHQSRTTLGGR